MKIYDIKRIYICIFCRNRNGDWNMKLFCNSKSENFPNDNNVINNNVINNNIINNIAINNHAPQNHIININVILSIILSIIFIYLNSQVWNSPINHTLYIFFIGKHRGIPSLCNPLTHHSIQHSCSKNHYFTLSYKLSLFHTINKSGDKA